MKKNKISIQLIQSSLIWESVDENLQAFERELDTLGDADLVLLPEMFTTGFSMRPEKLAADNLEALPWMLKMASKYQKAICGSVLIEEEGHYFNRLYFVEPSGKIHHYDKRHLFTMGEEPKHYTAGTERIIIDYLGWKILPLVCYDLRFPVFSRNDVGYDLLLYVANWPEKRAYHWKALLLARAIENQCYVAACNRVGQDGNGAAHNGDSYLIDFKGEILSALSQDAGIIEGECDQDLLAEAREKFPVLPDADSFSADWK